MTDACAVFTLDELAAGMGFTVTRTSDTWPEAKTSDGLPLVQCGWERIKDKPIEDTVGISVENFASVDRAKSVFQQSRVKMGNISFEELPNIGDEAIADRMVKQPAKPQQAAIRWRKGTAIYKLHTVRLDGLDPVAAEAKLVKIADAKF